MWIDKTFSRRPSTADGGGVTVVITDKSTFIYSNGPPTGLKSGRKLLKVGFISMHGQNFQRHFLYKNDISKYTTCKIIDRT